MKNNTTTELQRLRTLISDKAKKAKKKKRLRKVKNQQPQAMTG